MHLHRGANLSVSLRRPQARSNPLARMKQGKISGCRFFFCCPPQDVFTEDASIVNAIQRLRTLEKPERQDEGLMLLLTSYKEALDGGRDARDWATEWSHSGALHALASIASQLNSRVTEARIKLICRATLCILDGLPPNSRHFASFLDRLWNSIRYKGEGALAVYHLLLRILELPRVRQAAIQYGLPNLLWARYTATSSVSGMDEVESLHVAEDEEDLIDDLYCDSPGEETENECVANQMAIRSGPAKVMIPRLTFSWLKGRKLTPQPQSIMNQSRNKAVAWKDAAGAWPQVSPRRLPVSKCAHARGGTSKDGELGMSSDSDSALPSLPKASTGVESKLKPWAVHKVDEQKAADPDGGMPNVEAPRGGFPHGDPRQAWGLPEEYISSPQMSPAELERCAILEALMVLSALSNPGVSGLSPYLTGLILKDFRNGMRLQASCEDSNTARSTELSFKLACMHEFTSPVSVLTQVDGCPSMNMVATACSPAQDIWVLLAEESLDWVSSIRRPGSTIFARMLFQLDMMLEFISGSKSLVSAKSFLTLLNPTLLQIENQFKRVGRPENWKVQTFHAFVKLLRLYSLVLGQTGYTSECNPLVLRWCSNGSSSELLEGAAHLLMMGRIDGVTPSEGLGGQFALWEFFEALAAALVLQTKQIRDKKTDVAGEQHDAGLQQTYSGCISSWDYLLMPSTGLVSKALEIEVDADEGQGMGHCLHERVLGFLKEVMKIKENPFLEDRQVARFYLELHISRFTTLYCDILENEETRNLCNLHLEVIMAIMTYRQHHILEEMQEIGFPQYLQHQISDEALESERVHNPKILKERWKCPEDPLLGKANTHCSSPDIDELESFMREDNAFECRPTTEDNGILDEIDKALYSGHLGMDEQTVTGGEFAALDCLTSKDDSDDNENPVMDELSPAIDATVTLTRNADPERTLSFKLSIGSDSQDVWPTGLAITGDLEEDLIRWEAAEKQSSMGLDASTEALPSGSDSDDGLPLPASRPRPANVPRLSLNPCGIEQTPSYVSLSFRNLCDNDALATSASAKYHDTQNKKVGGSHPNPLVWADKNVHLTVIQILLEFLLLQESVQGSPRDKQDALVDINDMTRALFCHLNHKRFTSLIGTLNDATAAKTTEYGTLLRLFLQSSFDAGLYKTVNRVHHGERTQVQKCRILARVKVVDFPMDHSSSGCILDIFSEVSVLRTLKGQGSFSHLYDFGPTPDSIFLVLKEYRCTLLEWRQRLPPDSPWVVRLLLVIFQEILIKVQQLHSLSIVHFDLKCINILLDPLPNCPDSHFWIPGSENPCFRVVLADFGEARCYGEKEHAITVRTRGTEYLQSPEMLEVSTKMPEDFDRRRAIGAGPPTDVWGLGCLLYELMTGDMLQYDTEWMRFYQRVMEKDVPIIEESKARLIDESYRPTILSLLEFILVRDKEWRPSVSAMIDRVESILNSSILPSYTPPGKFLGHNTAMECFKQPSAASDALHDEVNLQERVKLNPGFTSFTGYLSVHSGGDSSFLRDHERLATYRTALIVLLEEGCDQSESRELLIGVCSRQGIEGVVVNCSNGSDMHAVLELAKLIEPYAKNEDIGTVVMCSDGSDHLLVKVLVELLACLHGCSKFEAQLEVCRRGNMCE